MRRRTGNESLPQAMGKRARKDTFIRGLQLGGLNGRGSFGEKGTPAMFIPLDLCPKEKHSSDLQIEADREPDLYSMPR